MGSVVVFPHGRFPPTRCEQGTAVPLLLAIAGPFRDCCSAGECRVRATRPRGERSLAHAYRPSATFPTARFAVSRHSLTAVPCSCAALWFRLWDVGQSRSPWSAQANRGRHSNLHTKFCESPHWPQSAQTPDQSAARRSGPRNAGISVHSEGHCEGAFDAEMGRSRRERERSLRARVMSGSLVAVLAWRPTYITRTRPETNRHPVRDSLRSAMVP